MKPIKRKVLDLETSKNILFNWHLRQKFNDHKQVLKHGGILTAAWKEIGSDTVYSCAVDITDPYDDEGVLLTLREELEGVDLVITQNGDKFDMRKINAGFFKYGIDPIHPIVSADIIKITKKELNMNSYAMDYVRKYKGLSGKTKTDDEWWRAVCEPFNVYTRKEKQQYLDLIQSYNMDDVWDTEELYELVKPYASRHPSINLIGEESDGCPTCGSENLITNKSWVYRAKTRSYQRYKCEDCGSWCRNVHAIGKVNYVSV